jgi:hypothetical protein
MTAAHPRINGKRPWDTSPSPEALCGPPAARQRAAYECERGCTFALPFAAGVVPPAVWDCRCGGRAHPEGATGREPEGKALPGWPHDYRRPKPTSPFGHVLERRSIADLEAALAERLAALRGEGA